MERVYTIPLRKAFKKPRTRRADAAIAIVRSFILKHMKSDDVKIGKELNEYIWHRGRKKIPRRVKIKAVIEEVEKKKVANVEIIGFEYKSMKVQTPKIAKETKKKIEERLGQKAIEKQKEEDMLNKTKKKEPEKVDNDKIESSEEEKKIEEEKPKEDHEEVEEKESEEKPEEEKLEEEKPKEEKPEEEKSEELQENIEKK